MDMNKMAHFLDRATQSPAIFFFLIIAIVLVIAIPRKRTQPSAEIADRSRFRWPRLFKIAMAVFLGTVGFVFLATAVTKFAARREITGVLSETVESVSVNGRLFQGPDSMVSALRNMCDTPAHHSHPTESYTISLKTNKKILVLNLRRDSQNAREYWVFYPGFTSTQENEVGRVCTDALDNKSQ